MLHRKNFAKLILTLRQEQKISLHDLAMFTRIEYMRMKRIEEAEVCPSLEEAATICNVLSHPLIMS